MIERFGIKVVAGVIGAVCIVALAWLALHWWTNAAQSAGNARVATEAGKSVSQSAKDAIGTVGASTAREGAIDTITEENSRAIHSANGADAPVDPAADAAGRASLCRRPAYRGRADCLQFTPAR